MADIESRIRKREFGAILLSRFLCMSAEGKFDLIQLLFVAGSEDSEKIKEEFSDIISELLFPEIMGELEQV